MQTIVDACGCHASKQSDSRDRGLISSLPIPYCTNSLLYVDFIHGLPRFGGYESCLVVTCFFCTERRLLWLARPGRKALARQAFLGRGGSPKSSSIAG